MSAAVYECLGPEQIIVHGWWVRRQAAENPAENLQNPYHKCDGNGFWGRSQSHG